MSDFVVDEQELSCLRDLVNGYIEDIKDDLGGLINEDLFIRYMSYYRLRSFMNAFRGANHAFYNMMHAGHMLNHEILQTKEAKKRGWSELKLEESSFFKVEDK